MTPRNGFDLEQKINLIKEKERGKKSGEWKKNIQKDVKSTVIYVLICFLLGTLLSDRPVIVNDFGGSRRHSH